MIYSSEKFIESSRSQTPIHHHSEYYLTTWFKYFQPQLTLSHLCIFNMCVFCKLRFLYFICKTDVSFKGGGIFYKRYLQKKRKFIESFLQHDVKITCNINKVKYSYHLVFRAGSRPKQQRRDTKHQKLQLPTQNNISYQLAFYFQKSFIAWWYQQL